MSMLLMVHLLGTVVWVGGMFFAHMALRPAVAEQLPPEQRLPLLRAVLRRFFRWVWLAIAAIVISGYWIFIVLWHGQAPLHVHLMQGSGLLMVGLFCFIYFVPFRRMARALDAADLAAAAAAMAKVRRIIGINLVLGILTVLIAKSLPYIG